MTDKAQAAQRLVEALTAAGFPEAGKGRGYVRFGWPGQEPPYGPLRVPLDGDAPEFGEQWQALLWELERVVARGVAARQALSAVAGIGCPRCGGLGEIGEHLVCAPCAVAEGWAT